MGPANAIKGGTHILGPGTGPKDNAAGPNPPARETATDNLDEAMIVEVEQRVVGLGAGELVVVTTPEHKEGSDSDAPPESHPHEDWRTPFLDWLIDQKLPLDQMVAHRLVRRAKSYRIIKGGLYGEATTGSSNTASLTERVCRS